MSICRTLLPTIAVAAVWATMGGAASAATTYPTMLETINVSNTSSSPVTSTSTLVPGHAYRIVARGEVSDWTSDPSGIYSGQAWGVDPLYCYATWRCPTPELWRQLRITNPGSSTSVGLDEWGALPGSIPYAGNHTYQADATGISGRLSFVGSDAVGSAGDNAGQWTVELWDLGGHDPDVTYSFRSYTNDVRNRPRFQLGVSHWSGNGKLTSDSIVGTSRSRNDPTYYPSHTMRTRVESFTYSTSGVRKVLVLQVIVTASSSRRNCAVGTRGTITLVDDSRRLRNGASRDSFTQIYPTSSCPSFVQGTDNRNHAHTQPRRGGPPSGGQWAIVNIAS